MASEWKRDPTTLFTHYRIQSERNKKVMEFLYQSNCGIGKYHFADYIQKMVQFHTKLMYDYVMAFHFTRKTYVLQPIRVELLVFASILKLFNSMKTFVTLSDDLVHFESVIIDFLTILQTLCHMSAVHVLYIMCVPFQTFV